MIDNPSPKPIGHQDVRALSNERLRDVAVACLGGGFVLGLVALGVFASKEGSTWLAVGLGVPAIALLALFGIVWDSQHPRNESHAERVLPGLRQLAWLLLIVVVVWDLLARA